MDSFIFSTFPAVRAGFEPAVQFPVRQFSKLLVSAAHPPHHLRCKDKQIADTNNISLKKYMI